MFTWGSQAVLRSAFPVGRLLNRSVAFTSCSKLFVGGLSYDTNEIALKDAFSGHGDVMEVKVICHPVTGRSKGYAFVKFSLDNEAAGALEKMSDEVLDGRNIRVHYANRGRSAADADMSLSYDTNEIALKDAFSGHGDVMEVKVICHPVTGRSKGYAFVKFSLDNEAAGALEKMSDEVLDGRNIRVHYANRGRSAADADMSLSYDTNEIALKDAFSGHGDVVEVKVICHPVTGRSKGYGFVKFSSENEAAGALEKMRDEVLDGRNIQVHYANRG